MRLTIKNLSKTYANGTKALQDFSLDIGKGMFGLLGQNGSGKSTLMRTIATLQTPDKGTLYFNGISILDQPDKIREELGYLPQEFGVYPNVSAYEMLMHLADMKGVAHKKERNNVVEALLAKVNLWDVKGKKLGGYSGGMKQRFGIAQALLNNPKLIIVDEPTAGLDPTERNRFYNLLSELSSDTIVILSTHIVEDVSTLCNDMAIIGDGRLLRKGKPGELERSMAGKLWVTEIPPRQLAIYQKEHLVISNCFHVGKMLVTVAALEKPGVDFSIKEPGLEDIYFYEIQPQRLTQNDYNHA